MKYPNITPAVFIDRPNRFTANVEINGRIKTVHVKNTGRCKELLIPGCRVYLTKSGNPDRKTEYDLVSVHKSNGLIINIDSGAPNMIAGEWLRSQNFTKIKPEYTYGDSRIDFYMEREMSDTISRYLMEVKGCTLEIDGIGYFPDAPTERGVKHLKELAKAAEEGIRSYIAFVIQMDGVTEVRPNTKTHPQFAAALSEATEKGVNMICIPCHVEPDSISLI